MRLLVESNKIVLKDSPIFKDNFSDKIIEGTIPLIEELRCRPEEVLVCPTGTDDQHAIYFIQSGKVELFTEKDGVRESIKVLEKGKSFGEIGFFTGQSRNINIRSIDFSTLLIIKREEFLKLLR